MKNHAKPQCPQCQGHEIRRKERQHIYHDPALTDPFTFMWQCLNPACQHIWHI
jgi:hypothetical protein